MLVESNKVELKVKYTNQVVKEIVAFLNAEGGKIYIGVDNDGKVVGVSNIDQILRSIYDIVASQIEPSAQDMVKAELENINGILVVVIIVKKVYRLCIVLKSMVFQQVVVQLGWVLLQLKWMQNKLRKDINKDFLTMMFWRLLLLTYRFYRFKL